MHVSSLSWVLRPPGYCVLLWLLCISIQMSAPNSCICIVYIIRTHMCSNLSQQDLFSRWSSCKLGTRSKPNRNLFTGKFLLIWKKTTVGTPFPWLSQSWENWKTTEKYQKMLKKSVGIELGNCNLFFLKTTIAIPDNTINPGTYLVHKPQGFQNVLHRNWHYAYVNINVQNFTLPCYFFP